MSRPLVRAAFFALLTLLFSCAEGTVDQNTDAGTEDAATSPSDGGDSNNQTTPMDAGGETDMDPCGVCCPGDVTCIDETTSGVCLDDGSDLTPTECNEGDVCEEGACITPPVCVPGETSCFDDETVLTCRGTADGFTTSPCDAGLVCFEGECVSGSPTGSMCDTDDECASGNCHCGSGTDEDCPSIATPGYCTRPCTNDGDCGADAYCMKSDFVPLGFPSTNYDHCAPSCAAVCGDGTTYGCIQAPHTTADDEITWDDTCFFEGIVEIGQECDSDAQCIGECMEDYITGGYCSRRCDNDGSCPVGASCVELRAGEFWCSLNCGDGSAGGSGECPRDVPNNNLSVSCQLKSGFEPDTLIRVCAAN